MAKRHSIVALEHFIQATRDSGYRGTISTVAELVDNSLQAGATTIDVELLRNEQSELLQLVVRDDGCGMTPSIVREALRFGGTTRFADRSGLGRFGMGLPTASLNQSRRFSVYTWRTRRTVWMTYLDIDEIAAGLVDEVPEPVKVPPASLPGGRPLTTSGTVVHWERCDRLDNRRISTIHRKLHVGLGRAFRYFIWNGAEIRVKGERVLAIDPLFLHPNSVTTGGVLEREWACEVRDAASPNSATGFVTVRFASLPVSSWSRWSNEEKRARGITNGAGVSVVRGGREVDYGWFFMGGKRRQNYDDWWRCEIAFAPILDHAFGIAHTKQQIRPANHLKEALTPFVEQAARELHAQVRLAQTNGRNGSAMNGRARDAILFAEQHPESSIVRPIRDAHEAVAEINPSHPFFASLRPRDVRLVGDVLLAAVRAEVTASKTDANAIRRFRERWSAELAHLSQSSR